MREMNWPFSCDLNGAAAADYCIVAISSVFVMSRKFVPVSHAPCMPPRTVDDLAGEERGMSEHKQQACADVCVCVHGWGGLEARADP